MPDPRLGRTAKPSSVDSEKVAQAIEGALDLRTALGVEPEVVEGLRRQARALCEVGKWQKCLEVMLGLAALDDLLPPDLVVMALAYEGLGDAELSAKLIAEAEGLMAAADLLLRTKASAP
jgi:hypothetical protein